MEFDLGLMFQKKRFLFCVIVVDLEIWLIQIRGFKKTFHKPQAFLPFAFLSFLLSAICLSFLDRKMKEEQGKRKYHAGKSNKALLPFLKKKKKKRDMWAPPFLVKVQPLS